MPDSVCEYCGRVDRGNPCVMCCTYGPEQWVVIEEARYLELSNHARLRNRNRGTMKQPAIFSSLEYAHYTIMVGSREIVFNIHELYRRYWPDSPMAITKSMLLTMKQDVLAHNRAVKLAGISHSEKKCEDCGRYLSVDPHFLGFDGIIHDICDECRGDIPEGYEKDGTPLRKCVTCGAPTPDYRCAKCWALLRAEGHYADPNGGETEFDSY